MEDPRTPSREIVRGHVALVAVQLCFGLFPLFGKWAFSSFEPRAIAGWRIAVGAAVLGGLAWWRHPDAFWPRRGELVRLQVCALLGITFNQVLYLEGLKRAPAVNAGLIMCLIPVYTLMIAALARQERLTWAKTAGTIIAFAGTAQLMLQREPDLGRPYLAGNLLMSVNSLSYSLYLVVSRPLTRKHPPLVLIAWVFMLASWTVPFFARDADWVPAEIDARSWLSLAFILAFPTVVGYLLNIFALARVPASTTAVYVFTQPVIAGTAGVLLLGEALRPGTLLAAIAIFAGIWLVVRPRRR